MNNEAYEGGLSMMSEYTELLKELRQQEEEILPSSFEGLVSLALSPFPGSPNKRTMNS
jgi:hypothetical protein